MVKFLFSRSTSWSVLLVSSHVLTRCRSALSRCGCTFTSCRSALFFLLIVHRPVLVIVSLLVRAATVRHVLRHATLLVRALLFEPLCSTSCSPVHVLTHVFLSWSAGCVTSLHVLRVVHCFLWSCSFALHESPACFVVTSPFTFTSPSCLLWSALAECLREGAIVWLLQPPALCVSSFSSVPGCTSLHEVCSRHCFDWRLVVSPATSTQSRVY